LFNLSESKIDNILIEQELKLNKALENYNYLQENLYKLNVSKDTHFQKIFNSYYKIIYRSSKWRSFYYKLLEENKYNEVEFSHLLKKMYIQTGNYEASFISKLVASIDTNYPVIDKYVLRSLDLKLPYSFEKDREYKIISIYKNIQRKIELFSISELGKYLILNFKLYFPEIDISETKMIDLILWQNREN
tara:strand:- start:720 stop:1289 length:570 start_codon:yes stop_codon:yes gene_type:complete